jgi:hypothetical protein
MKTTMKNTLKKLSLLFAFLLAPILCLAQQNTLVQTTTAAAIPPPTQTSAPNVVTLISLASVTGIQASGLNTTSVINRQNLWVVYIDREEMAIVGVNGTTLNVIRGYNSTVATAHVSGTMALYGRAEWFYQNDPGAVTVADGSVSGVPCTAATVFVTPWLNVRNGAQWICSATTGTWIPGWNNAGVPIMAGTQASVAGSTPVLGPYFQISGTNAITGFTIPVGFNGTAFGGGCFTAQPTGIWTWTAAGNISVLGTVTAATLPVTFCWNAATSKWIPSRVS